MSGISDFINSAIDTTQAVANHPAIRLVGVIFPRANAVIDFIQRYGPVIDAAQPVIAKAIDAGIPVYHEVVAQLPKFSALITEVVHLIPDADLDAVIDMKPEVFVENLTRAIGGFGKMTPEQELRWMNQMTPGNDPSQENSKYTVG